MQDYQWALIVVANNILNNKNGKIFDILPFVNLLLEYHSDAWAQDNSVFKVFFDRGLINAFSKDIG